MKALFKISILLVLLCGFQTVNAEWVKQNTNRFTWFKDVFFVNENKGWIVGADGVILSTIDGGATWLQPKRFTSDAIVQIHFTDETNGWMLCERNIYRRGADAVSYLRRTTDGGLTWEKIEFEEGGRQRITKVLFHQDGRAAAFGEGGILYKLQPDGVSWKKNRMPIHYLLLDAALLDDRVGAIVGSGGTIMFTQDSGFTWEKATLRGDLDTRFNAVYFAGEKAAWAVGSQGRIFRSSGGGRLWRQQQSGVTTSLNDVYFSTETDGWAVGDSGVMLRTRHGGNTWTNVPSRTPHRLEKVIFAGRRGWAIGFGGTVLTYDDGPATKDRGTKPILMKRG